MKKYIVLAILVLLVITIMLARTSNGLIRINIANELEKDIIEKLDLKENVGSKIVGELVKELIVDKFYVSDYLLFKKVELTGVLEAEYLYIFGNLFELKEIHVDEKLFINSSTKEKDVDNIDLEIPYLYTFQTQEIYTNIPVDDRFDSYKILKIQAQIVTYDNSLISLFEDNEDVINDAINGFFRDITVNEIENGGKEMLKSELKSLLGNIFETDEIIDVLLVQFIIA